ncbi:hypothetical protein [Microbacterium sp. No. 7]|uniref:hypothetical protein n=1 Tax=Microbacterium sp. No. 7 TaxID=1714373 RepID=UPI0006CF9826|nr:hypothetical protein [Microbacterium sp. No. 7]ALJ18460.1 hypothetical protein AOA12_00420 [Microbacterium sp. No. 7]
MPVLALAIADLVLLLVAAAFGLTSLLAWMRHRGSGIPPVAKIATHVALQVVSIGVWTAFVVTGSAPVAWAAFAIITVGQVFGDLLMFASYRARHPGTTRPGYRAVSGDVLGFRRPAAALHALVGAIAWFGMLGICILASVPA